MRMLRVIGAAVLVLAGAAGGLQAQNYDTVRIRTTPVAGRVYLLQGAGGNIGLFAGREQALLIDDEFAPLLGRITTAVAELTPAPIRLVFNTHWHADHVGANEGLGRAGATLVAHENVRRRMSAPQFTSFVNRTTPAAAPGALPVVTFADAITFHVEGEEIVCLHVDSAHTDGDAIVRFVHENVVDMGDLFFNGGYPFVDLSSGGTIDGMIRAADAVLAIADSATRIIPGHGPLADRRRLAVYRDMLAAIRDEVARRVTAGESLETVIAAHPTARFDAEWGQGWIRPAQFVEFVYRSLAPRRN